MLRCESSRIALTKANLVHDGNSGILALLVKLHHGGRDVASGDDILLLADGRLDYGSVVRIGDQADDKVVLGNLSVQSLVVAHVESDGGGALDANDEGLGRVEGPAGLRAGSVMVEY